MHFLTYCLVLYLFGAFIFMLWELEPIITSLAIVMAVGLTILEDFKK